MVISPPRGGLISSADLRSVSGLMTVSPSGMSVPMIGRGRACDRHTSCYHACRLPASMHCVGQLAAPLSSDNLPGPVTGAFQPILQSCPRQDGPRVMCDTSHAVDAATPNLFPPQEGRCYPDRNVLCEAHLHTQITLREASDLRIRCFSLFVPGVAPCWALLHVE